MLSKFSCLIVLPSNVSQCTSTTDSQEHALNCTVHKILLTVFTINQLIPLSSDSYSNILSKPWLSLASVWKDYWSVLIWSSYLKFRVSDVWTEISHEHKPRWRDLLTWDLLLSDFIRFLTCKSHFCDSLLTQWYVGLQTFVPDLRISENSVVGK